MQCNSANLEQFTYDRGIRFKMTTGGIEPGTSYLISALVGTRSSSSLEETLELRPRTGPFLLPKSLNSGAIRSCMPLVLDT